MQKMNIFEAQKLQEEFEYFLKDSQMQKTIDEICKDIIEQKNNAIAMEFTKSICGLLRENKIYVHLTETETKTDITENSITERYGILFDGVDFSEHDKPFLDEIKELKSRIEELECNERNERLTELEDRHQQDCIELKKLSTTIDVLADKLAKTMEVCGL